MTMRRTRQQLNIKSDINVTPFVDVMLVLLIVFMISAPMMVGGIEVSLPEMDSKTLSGDDEPVIVSITKDGRIFLQEMKVSPEELNTKLQFISKQQKDMRIFVRGDKDVKYGAVLSLFNLVKSADFNNVALVTESEK